MLHWLSAAILFIQIPLGFYLVDLDFGDQRITIEDIHVTLGLTVFYIIIIRLINNILNPTPKLDPSISEDGAGSAFKVLWHQKVPKKEN